MNDDRHPQNGETPPVSLSRTVMRGAGFAASGYAIAQALNLLIYIFLARLLTPSDFGVFAAATVLLGFLDLTTEGGMMPALIQRPAARLREAMSTATYWMVVAGIGMSLAAAAASPLIGHFFRSSEITQVAAVMSGIVFLRSITAVPEAYLQRNFSFLRRLVIEPVRVVVFGGTAIGLALMDWGIWALVAGQYAGAIADVALSWLLVRFRPKFAEVSFTIWKELASYGRHVLVSTLIVQVGEQASAPILGRALGEGPLGQFRYAFRLATTPYQLLLAASAYVLFPAFSRIRDERARLQAAFMRSLRWMAIAGIPAGLILIPTGEALSVLLFGDQWRAAGRAAAAMALYTAAGSLSALAIEALKAEGRPDRLTWINSVTAGVTVAAMLALVPWGLTAAAASVSIGALAGAIVALAILARTINLSVRDMLLEVLRPSLAALVMILVALAADRFWIDTGAFTGLALAWRLAIELLIAGLTYFAVLAALIPTATGELTSRIAKALKPSAR